MHEYWYCEQVKRHEMKMAEVQSQLQEIEVNNRRGRGVEISEFERQQDMRRPLQAIITQYLMLLVG